MDIKFFPDPPSNRQKALLLKLTLSSEFSDEEAERTRKWLDSPSCTKQGCMVLISKALARIGDRDARKKASEARKQKHREGVS